MDSLRSALVIAWRRKRGLMESGMVVPALMMSRVLSCLVSKGWLLVVGDLVEGLLAFLEVAVTLVCLGTASGGGGGTGGQTT